MARRFENSGVEGSHRTPREWPWSNTPPRLRVRRALAFAAAAALFLYLALDGGGYDLIVRQTVAAVVWALVAVGFALGTLPRARPPRLAMVPAVAAAAMTLWLLLSFTWTASDGRTMAELARWLGYAGIALLATTALNRHTFRAAAAGLSAAALAVAAIAVWSRLAPGSFPGSTDVAVQFRSDRLDFPLDYWNAIGAWGAMACAIGLAWSAHARLLVTRAICLAMVPVAGLAVYLSYSRGGAIGAAVALVAVLVLSRNRWTAFVHALAVAAGTGLAILVARSNPAIADATGSEGAAEVALALLAAAGLGVGAVVMTSVLRADRARLPRETARWAVPGFVIIVLVLGIAAGGGAISEAWDEFRNDDSPATGDDPAVRLTTGGGNRNDIWRSAIDAFESEPVTGVGAGTFEFWWLAEGDDPEYVRDAHSLYLEMAAELGLPGALLLVAALGGLLALALYARRFLEAPGDVAASVAMTSAFVVFCVNAGVDWMWEETAVGALAIGGVAVAAAAAGHRLPGRRRRGAVGRPGVRAVVVAGAVAAALVQVPGIVSTDRTRASEAALAAGDLAGARELADQAVDAEPWAAAPRGQLATVQREAGDYDGARASIEGAIEREPESWEWPLVQALVESDAGNRAAAIDAFTSGRRLGPRLYFYSPFSIGYATQIYTRRALERKYARQQAKKAAIQP